MAATEPASALLRIPMKLKIEKTGDGKTYIVFSPTTASKPVRLALTDQQIEQAVGMLQMSKNFQQFSIDLEIGK